VWTTDRHDEIIRPGAGEQGAREGRMAPRRKVISKELTDLLVAQASVLLGHDARFIAPHMKVSRSGGEPNWDAKLDIFGSALITQVFNEARDRTKALYELQ
jgi:hypothetical protein